MSFLEKSDLKDERRPLLRDPVWHYNHRYGRTRVNDPEDSDDHLGLESARNLRFQWMLFLGVTLLSILILLATMGILIKLSQTHPSVGPYGPTTTTTPLPSSKLPIVTPSTPATEPNIPSSTPTTSTTGIYVYVNGSSPNQNG